MEWTHCDITCCDPSIPTSSDKFTRNCSCTSIKKHVQVADWYAVVGGDTRAWKMGLGEGEKERNNESCCKSCKSQIHTHSIYFINSVVPIKHYLWRFLVT